MSKIQFPGTTMLWGGTLIAGALGCGVAWAGSDDKLPLSLSLSETVTRDTNFSRTDDPVPETVLSTSVLGALDKSIGRQHYVATAQWADNRYHNYKKLLNNQSKLFNGSFSSELLTDWQVSLGGNYSQNLNPIKDNVTGDRVVKNIRTYNDRNASLRYGLSGEWSLTGSVDGNTVRYSRDAYKVNNADQHSRGLTLNYSPTDLVSYGLGYRQAKTHYFNYADNRTLTDHNLSLSAAWQVTGVSSLNTTLTRRRTTHSEDSMASTRNWDGSVGWTYTPAGIWSYGFNASRYAGTDRVNTVFTNVADATGRSDSVLSSTNYSVNTAAALTGKTTARVTYTLNRNRYNYSQVFSNLGGYYCFRYGYCDYSNTVKSVQHTLTMSLSSQLYRFLGTQCSVQIYGQTRDQYDRRFQGREVDCTLSLLFE